ncbi:MAG: aromatic-ring-hydroxylating dioxygenase subunit beta [Porticoccaceae bacterium]
MTLKESVEKFLFEEADLLDRWQLNDWEALLTDDAEYLVPPIGLKDIEETSYDTTLFIIADDRAMLGARVERMSGKNAYCENPRSNIRHLVSNVRVLEESGDTLSAVANFCVYRVRRSQITQYMGQYRYLLKRDGDSFRIRRKTAYLDLDALAGQGGLGFIL